MNWLERVLQDRKKAALLIGAALILTRLQTLFIPVYNGDEANYAGHALVMLGGGIPYVGFVEKKPPLIYCFYWLVFKLFGTSLIAVHAVTLLVVGATAYFIARQIRTSPVHAHLGALLYVVFSTCFTERDVLATNCEILMNLPAAAAGWALLSSEKRRGVFWCGVLTGLAFLFKHQAGIGLAAAGLYLIWKRKRWLADELALTAGFLLPSLIVIAVYAHLGRLAELYEWNIVTNFSYVGAKLPFKDLFANAAQTTLTFVVANGLLFALAALAFRRSPFHAMWLLSTAIPIAMGGRFYGHYYVQAYPPLCVLAALKGGDLVDRKWMAPLIIAPALFFQIFSLARYHDQKFEAAWHLNREVGAAVDKYSRPGEEIFVWGNYAYPYYFADRRPATRYIVCEYVLPFWEVYLSHRDRFTDADLQPYHREAFRLLMEDLRAHRPRVIVDTTNAFKSWKPFPLSAFPELDAFVRADYDAVETVGGVTILRRRSP